MPASPALPSHVIKRDGGVKPFDAAKIASAIARARSPPTWTIEVAIAKRVSAAASGGTSADRSVSASDGVSTSTARAW